MAVLDILPSRPARGSRLLPWLFALLAAMALLCALGASPPAHAQPTDQIDPDTALDNVRKQLDGVQKALKSDEMDADLLDLRSQVQDAHAKADQVAGAIAPALADVQVRLAQLGKPAEGTREAPDVAQQRAQLERNRVKLDAQLKLAHLLGVEADQAFEQIRSARRSLFQAQLGERTASILATRFWSDLKDDMPRDLVRLKALYTQIAASTRPTPRSVWIGALAAIVLVALLRFGAGRLLLRITSTKVPPGRLRRSLHAFLVVVLDTLTPGLMAMALYIALTWNGDGSLSEDAANILASTNGAIWFAGYVAGLGHAMLSPRRPSWRLRPIPDRVAWALRWFPIQLAVLIVVAWVTERLGSVVNASLSTTVAVNCIVALAMALVLGVASMKIEHLRRQALREADQPIAPRPLWLALLAIASSVVLTGALACLLVGYVAFGSFAVKQVVWVLIVLGSGYLLATLIDDLCMSFLASSSRDAAASADAQQAAASPQAQEPKARDQAAVLLSGVSRLLVLMTGITLILAPFGDGPTDLFRRANQIQSGLKIGEVLIQPGTVLQALVVLGVGWFCVRWLKSWLQERYLPTTGLDAGMQLSAATLFSYVGYVVAIALAMSALGMGLERVAWVASALSVGIGFGLQAVVQNFVSGLILLAERPVKVGDWVSLGGVEGDIRRINVRATEIQMGDRSTVIVPNSEFITKTVRNMTHASPLGLVQMKLPMPLNCDVEQVREIILAAFKAHPDVLENPPPKVQLEAVETVRLVFSATGSVSSPRMSYGVRSDLLFTILGTLAQERAKAAAQVETQANVPPAPEAQASETPAPEAQPPASGSGGRTASS